MNGPAPRPLLVAAAWAALAAAAAASTPPFRPVAAATIPDGAVTALAERGHELFLAGQFTRLGPWTGPGFAVDAASGALAPATRRLGAGAVTAVAGDGRGGWYVACTEPSRIVHVAASGAVDPAFDPAPAGDGATVSALALAGGRLYVGGTTQPNLAALDPQTGRALPAFDAGADGPVLALLAAPDRLYAGGSFTRAGGAAQAGLAALDPATGAAVPGFAAGANGAVRALSLAGATLYAGGDFTQVEGASRNHAAAVDAASGAVDPAFDPNVDGPVLALAALGDRVLLGGAFDHAGGAAVTNLAAVGAANGAADPAYAGGGANGTVTQLVLDGDRLFAGGGFNRVGGASHPWVALLDARTGAPDARFRSGPPVAGSPAPRTIASGVHALAVQGDALYIGGEMFTWGGAARPGLAALRLPDLTPDPRFAPPRATPAFQELVVAGRRVYGMVRGGLGDGPGILRAFDRASGRPIAGFRAPALDRIDSVAAGGGALFVAGEPSILAPEVLWRLDGRGQRVRAFRPDVPRGPFDNVTLAVLGRRLYVGMPGDAEGRGGVRALDPVSGRRIRGFRPPPGADDVWGVFPGRGRIYVVGTFSHVGRLARGGFAALSPATGAPLRRFDPPGVNAAEDTIDVVEGGSRVYVQDGGDIAMLDRRTGRELREDYFDDFDEIEVDGLAPSPHGVLLGGSFFPAGATSSSPLPSPYVGELVP